MKYTANLEENLIEIQNELIYHTYEVGRYREFFVYEPKQRLVMALPFKDRVVQWAIYRVLNPIFEKTYYEHSYACRVGKGTHAAANQLQDWVKLVHKKTGKWYYLKLDVSKYFYRIDHDVLLKIIRRKIKDEELMSLLEKIIRSETTNFGLPSFSSLTETEDRLADKGMPIGNLTSQLFANIYLNELDQYVKHELDMHYYIRYMDDIVMLSDNKKDLMVVKDEIERFLNENLKLNLNNKTCIRPIGQGVEFVGFRIWNTHMKLRKSSTLRMKRNLKQLQKKWSKSEIGLEEIKQSLASYRGLLKHSDSYRFVNKLSHDFVLTKHEQERSDEM